MRPDVSKKLVALLWTLLFLLVLHFVVYGRASLSIGMMVGWETVRNPLLMEGSMLLLSGVLYANISQLLANRVSVRFVRVEAMAYFVVLFAVVMLKSPGIQGFNLDVSDLYREIIGYPVSVLVNLLLFAPVGMLAIRYVRSLPKALALALGLIGAIETVQYVLHLGIFDVVDIILNMIGFTVGYLVLGIMRDAGFRVVQDGTGWATIVRPQKARQGGGDEDGSVGADGGGPRRKLVALVVLLGVLALLFVAGFVFADY
jgi:glycopeptide antibiotics resistance protein